METKQNHLYSLATLQLIAVVTIVMGHLWVSESISVFMNSVCVSFCFVYSGFFTAKRHNFDSSYRLNDHYHYMLDKLAKMYPMYVLALVVCLFAFVFLKGQLSFAVKTVLIHLSLLSPWFSSSDIYFGYNAVGWWICDLFFLYLISPLIVRVLRPMRLPWQALLIVVLLGLEFIGGYRSSMESDSLLLNYYHMYEFPPIRILDFATGIVIFNTTQCAWWKQLSNKLTSNLSTVIEALGVLVFAVLYWFEKTYLHEHCFRAFCILAPSVVVLLMTFILTSSKMGLLSRLLSSKPLVVMQQYTFEIYLLQLGVYFALEPLCNKLGISNQPILHFVVQNGALLLAAWVTHKYYVVPIYRRLGRNRRH